MAEPSPIEFYFDFISPFGWFGSHMIEPVAQKHGRRLDWRPMLLGISVMKVMGLPPVPQTPLKGPYSSHDAPRFARLLGLPFRRAGIEPMAPLPAGRAFTWLKDQDEETAVKFAKAVMARYWQGEMMDDPDRLAEEAEKLGVDGAALKAALGDDAVKARHREWVDLSLEKGVFGVPTFIVDGEMFWGADRVWMVDRWLETGGW
jgi:2-hydroxychromene-2-carboxylate isomerase